ncbi:MAG: nucleotide sugar dehydrogenase [Opitutales bacterium]|nr:nucleotide sugar dehydrogenase [Opitutales bacterium]
MRNERISIIGLGKLGSAMVAAFVSRGFNVIGVDVINEVAEKVNKGIAPVSETGLDDLLKQNKNQISATTDHEGAVCNTDVSFVIVPTPSDPDGGFSIQYARHAMREIGTALKKKGSWHLVVMTSTVLPGSCRNGLITELEKTSGLKCGDGFGFCYSPEFIALGSVLHDFLNPDFNLVGEWDVRSGDLLEAIYEQTVLNGAKCQRMSLENAELAKVSLNSFVTMKIAFANVIADICQTMEGGDVDAVTEAIGLDKRIGLKYLKGGMSFGGPCFPRDNKAFAFLADQMEAGSHLAKATDQLNNEWIEKTVESICSQCEPHSNISILGLAYKPESVVLEDSPSIAIAQKLVDLGYRVSGYDPIAGAQSRSIVSNRFIIHDTVEDTITNANFVLIATPDEEFKRLTQKSFDVCNPQCVVMDAWRILEWDISNQCSTRYFPLGVYTPNFRQDIN